MLVQISYRCLQDSLVLTKHTDALVAARAKKLAYPTCDVVVVYVCGQAIRTYSPLANRA